MILSDHKWLRLAITMGPVAAETHFWCLKVLGGVAVQLCSGALMLCAQ